VEGVSNAALEKQEAPGAYRLVATASAAAGTPAGTLGSMDMRREADGAGGGHREERRCGRWSRGQSAHSTVDAFCDTREALRHVSFAI